MKTFTPNYLLTTDFITRAIETAIGLTIQGRPLQQRMTGVHETLKVTGATASFRIDCNHGLLTKLPTVIEALLAKMVGRRVSVHPVTSFDYLITVD